MAQIRKAVLNGDNNWQSIFTGLPLVVPSDINNVDAPDEAATYRVVETQVNGESVDEVVGVRDGSTYSFTITNDLRR